MNRIIVLLIVLVLLISAGVIDSADTTYYVSRNGSNGDGTSWATAWNELNQINWSVIQPGDTILVAEGTYNST